MIVGVDEAGRGPLAGAVVACSLGFEPRCTVPFTAKDSKQISRTKREEMFSWLVANAKFSIGIASAGEIDRLNILQATFLAFERAITGMLNKYPGFRRAEFIIDGNVFQTKLKVKYSCVKKADETIREVSCASIMAKVTRDYLMDSVDFLYPEWGFAEHKGYPTRRHFSLLEKYPLTPFHRQSFSPCGRNGFTRRSL